MRPVLACGVIFCCSVLACASMPPYAASNSTKLAEAAVFAGVAAAAQIAESAAEARARNNAPVTHSSIGLNAGPQCDNYGQYPCVTLTVSPPSGGVRPPPEQEMTEDELRDYVLAYVNGVRKLKALGALVREPKLDAFAQAGSDELSRDHVEHGHRVNHPGELDPLPAELQDSPDGARIVGFVQDGIGEILLRWMDEAPDGPHRGALLCPEWHKMGVGVASRDGRAYLTIDFSP